MPQADQMMSLGRMAEASRKPTAVRSMPGYGRPPFIRAMAELAGMIGPDRRPVRRYPVNVYPTPRIDRKCLGLCGSASKYLRKETMKLSIVRVVGNTS